MLLGVRLPWRVRMAGFWLTVCACGHLSTPPTPPTPPPSSATPTLEAQRRRFTDCGWHRAEAYTMDHVYRCLPISLLVHGSTAALQGTPGAAGRPRFPATPCPCCDACRMLPVEASLPMPGCTDPRRLRQRARAAVAASTPPTDGASSGLRSSMSLRSGTLSRWDGLISYITRVLYSYLLYICTPTLGRRLR